MSQTHPLYASMKFPAYEHREYPKMLYHGTDAPVTVYNAKQEEALGADWHPTPAAAGVRVTVNPAEATVIKMVPLEACATSVTAPAAKPVLDRDALLKLADELGVDVSPKWSVQRLHEEIEKATT